jgi:hypothetical protein
MAFPLRKSLPPISSPLFLGNSTDTKEGNRLDYSMTGAPDVWNGEETSGGSYGPIYVDTKEDLTAGTSVYNRFGSNIYETGIVFTDSQTYTINGTGPDDWDVKKVSSNIGNPAPLSLAVAEIGYEVASDPLAGIAKYFDPEKDTCINYAAIANVRGWFDPTYSEYNILLPVGTSQTTINTWLSYDLVRRKWTERVPATYPQVAFPAQDTNGAVYTYGATDDGIVMRLEHGDDWDGSDISYTIKTADILPTGNIWDQTRIRRVKVLSQTPDLEEGETVTIQINHYADGETTESTSLDNVVIDPSSYTRASYLVDENSNFITDQDANRIIVYQARTLRHIRDTQETDLLAHSHAFEFILTGNSYEFVSNFGKSVLGFGFVAHIEREDRDETLQ